MRPKGSRFGVSYALPGGGKGNAGRANSAGATGQWRGLIIAGDEAVVWPEHPAPGRLVDARAHAADTAVQQADDAHAVDRLDPVRVTRGDGRLRLRRGGLHGGGDDEVAGVEVG